MRMENKGGDTLAAGGVKCQFPPAGGGVSQEKWDAIWGPEWGTKSGSQTTDENGIVWTCAGSAVEATNGENGSLRPDSEATGNVSPDSGASIPDATGF